MELFILQSARCECNAKTGNIMLLEEQGHLRAAEGNQFGALTSSINQIEVVPVYCQALYGLDVKIVSTFGLCERMCGLSKKRIRALRFGAPLSIVTIC